MRTIDSEIMPMMCGSAFKNKGVQAMLDAVIDYMPHRRTFRRSRAKTSPASGANAAQPTTSRSRPSRSRS